MTLQETPEFLGLLKQELQYQARRLASHPSLFLWSGSNEEYAGPVGGWWDAVFLDTMFPALSEVDRSRPVWAARQTPLPHWHLGNSKILTGVMLSHSFTKWQPHQYSLSLSPLIGSKEPPIYADVPAIPNMTPHAVRPALHCRGRLESTGGGFQRASHLQC